MTEIDDALRVLRYDWRALSRVREDYGVDWTDDVERALATPDVATLATVLSCAFDRSDPRSDPAWWMDQSPPIADAQRALDRAMTTAMTGPPGAEVDPVGEAKPPRRVTWWRRLFGLGAGSVGALPISGN